MPVSGTTIYARLDELARHSEDNDQLTRTFMTPAHRAAAEQLQVWMLEAGMTTRLDAIGNVIGRYEGHETGLPAVVIGSHYDTVRNAGKYDGPLGVLAGIACVAELNHQNERFPFALEVVGFSEEEGVRYGATLLGSRAFAGTFDYSLLTTEDADGVTMADAMRHCGLDPESIASAARSSGDILAYIEAHIEQGPVLLQEALPVGVVTSIAGASRYQVTLTGRAGHAGTVPMTLRHDSLCAASEIVLFIEQRCARAEDTFGTVGKLEVVDGAANTIPATVTFTIDIRAGDDATRLDIIDDLTQQLEKITEQRGVVVDLQQSHAAGAARCAASLIDQLESAIAHNGITPRKLVSGAGHDAMALTDLTAIVMLFVRCGNGGISHHPDETMSADDAEIAVNVLLDFIRNFKAG